MLNLLFLIWKNLIKKWQVNYVLTTKDSVAYSDINYSAFHTAYKSHHSLSQLSSNIHQLYTHISSINQSN